MKLLANENFPLKSILYLRSKEFDVLSIGTNNLSIKDEEVMTIAINEERTILTFDRDYGELIFRHNYKPPKGVIYLRISSYSPEDPGKLIESLLNDSKLNFYSALTVVDDNGIRQRKF